MTARFADAVDAAELGRLLVLTSEVVTNAVVHAGADAGREIGLRLSRGRGAVRVGVSDLGSGGVPVVRDLDPFEPGGLGLLMVERMSERWGVDPRGERGHEVWFEFRLSHEPRPEWAVR
jgi:anti-sigma regulatory factor (Ser/Thr protein kinase)